MKNQKAMKSNVTYVKAPWLFSFLFILTTTLFSNIVIAQRQNLIVESTFEGTNPFNGWQYGYQFCCTYSVTQSTAFARAGTSSVKYDLRSSDPIVSSSLRAEIEPLGAGGDASQEMERWYGLSYYLVNYGSDDGAESILQWHDQDGTCPPLSLQVQGGHLRIQQCINNSNTPNDLGPVVSNQWFDIVLHVKWTTTNTGILQVWKDGVLVVNKSNVRTNSTGGSYLKLGINKWSWAPGGGSSNQTQRVFYIDEFRMGNANATYADVAPGSTTVPPGNQSPTVNAGNNITLTLPTNTTSLTGTANDPDGNIQTYAWTRVSGPTTYSLGTPAAATTTLSNLVAGTYVFRLTVTDNGGATATDDVNVIVNPAPNQAPTVSAGNDITLTLPTNTTSLTGTANDPDGNIQTYAWTRVSGPTTYSLGTPAAATTALSNLVQGTYVFKLTVTDNSGTSTSDNVNVIVNAAPNQAPTARAGSDQVITLPIALATLDGSGSSDPDGTIQSYSWSRVSGPATFSLLSPLSVLSIVNSLLQGTYVFKLTVTDNNGVSASDNVTITVNPLPIFNQPPAANAGNDQVITLPTNSTTLTGTATDVDGTIQTSAWSMVSGPAGYSIVTPDAASTTVSGLVQGTYVFSYTATDDDGAADIDYVRVTVNAAATSPNQSPAANAGNDVALTLPTNSTTLNGSGIDPDGTIDTYAWSKISGPAGYALANPASASTALSNLVQGIYVFRLTVTDDAGATASAFVTITVNAAPPPVNTAPTVTVGNDITITLPTNSTTLSGAGTDAEGPVTYGWSKISGPNAYAFGNSSAATTPLTGLVQGTYVFRLTVADNNGTTATAFITVTVNPAPNQAPVAHAGTDITITLPINSTTLNGNTSTDPDGSIITYVWSRVSGPATYQFSNPGASSTGVSNLLQGTYVFRLTVTDNSGVSASDDVTVTVNPAANVAPLAHAGNDITITLPVSSAALIGSTSTDPDGSIITWAWSRVSGPTSYSFANAGASATNVSTLTQGVYVFRLTVTDNSGATATDDVTVTVNPAANVAPVAHAGNDITITLPVSSAALIGSTSTDPDGSIITWAWSRVSGPTSYSFANAGASATNVSTLTQGVYVFRLTITDNSGLTATDDVTVTVNPAAAPPPNQLPVAHAGNDVVMTLPTNSTALNGTTSVDPDGTIDTWAWSRVSGPTTYTMSTTSGATIGVTGLVQGTYVFRLTVTDNRGGVASDDITVTVNAASTPPPANQPPIANAGTDMIIYLDSSIALNGIASTDPDGVIASYEWHEVSGPSQVTMTNARVARIPLSGLMIGEYIFELKVTDNSNATATARVKIIVKTKSGEALYCNIYPNPTRDNLNIQYTGNNTGKVLASVYDAHNRIMIRELLNKDLVTMNKTMDVSKLKPGTYFLQLLLSGNKMIVKKFIKL